MLSPISPGSPNVSYTMPQRYGFLTPGSVIHKVIDKIDYLSLLSERWEGSAMMALPNYEYRGLLAIIPPAVLQGSHQPVSGPKI